MARPVAAAAAAVPHLGAPPRPVLRPRACRRRAGGAGAAENEHPGTRPLYDSDDGQGRASRLYVCVFVCVCACAYAYGGKSFRMNTV